MATPPIRPSDHTLVSRERRRTLAEVIAALLAGVVLLVGLFVWLRFDLAEQVYSRARLWFYDNYGFSQAWSTSLAVIAAVLVVANASVIVGAVFFGFRRLQTVIATAVLAVAGAAIYEYRSSDQCFHRRTGEPLCTLYRGADGTLVVRRTDGPAVPAAMRPLRIATQGDVVRYGTTEEERERRRPKPIDIPSCGRGTDFFDAETGESLIYYVAKGGEYEFFSSAGFHPTTGEHLRPVSRTDAATICKQLAEKAERERKEAQRQQAVEQAKRDAEDAKRRRIEAAEQAKRDAEDERRRRADAAEQAKRDAEEENKRRLEAIEQAKRQEAQRIADRVIQPNMSVAANGFKIVLSSVRRSGGDLLVELLVTAEQDNLGFHVTTQAGQYSGHSNTNLYDRAGTLYTPTRRAIAGGQELTNYPVRMDRGVPTRFTVVFGQFPQSAEVASVGIRPANTS